MIRGDRLSRLSGRGNRIYLLARWHGITTEAVTYHKTGAGYRAMAMSGVTMVSPFRIA